MVKTRLYELDDHNWQKNAAKYTLHQALLSTIKLFAPVMPHITEEIFLLHFAQYEKAVSVHQSKWPEASADMINESADLFGNALVSIASEIRRYKSNLQMSMGEPLARLRITSSRSEVMDALQLSVLDVKSVTRAQDVIVSEKPDPAATSIQGAEDLWITIEQ
jgi:valyl-tRNA synthetase